jgi:hypothetical protein
MKIWIDEIGPTLEGYIWCKSVNEAKEQIEDIEKEQQYFYNLALEFFHSGKNLAFHNVMSMCKRREIELIAMNRDNSDYIRLLDWFKETGRNYPILIHSMNPVGVANMRRIIERNGWKEIK